MRLIFHKDSFLFMIFHMEPARGIEPPTSGLQNRCSTVELHRQHVQRRIPLHELDDPDHRNRQTFPSTVHPKLFLECISPRRKVLKILKLSNITLFEKKSNKYCARDSKFFRSGATSQESSASTSLPPHSQTSNSEHFRHILAPHPSSHQHSSRSHN